MATVSGSGRNVSFTTTNPATQADVQAAFNSAATAYVTGGAVTSGEFVAYNQNGAATITGAGGPGSAVTGFLPDAPPNSPVTYQTGTEASSTIYASDKSQASIVNNNPSGALNASFGAGGGVGDGYGESNTFTTDPGSKVTLNFGPNPGTTAAAEPQQANVAFSYGQDTINIGAAIPGQSQSNLVIGYGTDAINLSPTNTLNFINNGSGVSSVNASSDTMLTVGGRGHTSVTAGSAGQDNLGVDTTTGNVTLAGAVGGNDIFTFMRAASEAGPTSGVETVQNYTAGEAVVLQGYGAGNAAYTTTTQGSSTVVTLSDNTKITFQNYNGPINIQTK